MKKYELTESLSHPFPTFPYASRVNSKATGGKLVGSCICPMCVEEFFKTLKPKAAV